MEEEMLSMNEESSNSNCGIHIFQACKFKGVVPQQNGHWGAQIYANHQRIWLGTFKSEIDAAMAYDSAAIKLRDGETHRNFPWTRISIQEPKFQSHFSTEAILNMIRNGSYPSRFAEFLRSQKGEIEIGLNVSSLHGAGEFSCKLLFQKELTPSDVGKLNRLVIPKKYAVKYFQNVTENTQDDAENGRVDEVQLEFYDTQMRVWKFRYCYWKSSQSYVFTRGWNRFVREKELRANDIIAFYMYENRDRHRVGQTFCVIDVANKGDTKGRMTDLRLDLGRNANYELIKEEKEEFEKEMEFVGIDSSPSRTEPKSFELFGVSITL
ncbi:AP2/ERF and B3 domain-containing transcription factor [Abeliophyllum distichum]|uniref:AP2/ERF and B3 domain-containing transcription factor n=1 Tax=Abeliophyllum distichum TaxID=126358 RepID=A0ABD1NP34_9LAMI